jgi:hypothetical protein
LFLPVLAALVLTAGCAGTGDLAVSPEADRRAARRALAEAAQAGPVPLVVAGDPAPLAPADLPRLAAQGVRGLDPRFEAGGGGGGGERRLVLWFDPPPDANGARACGAEPLGAAPSAPVPRLLAAWCEGEAPAASVRGEAPAASRAEAERLVWRATARLFPDDYADTYGFDLFGFRVGLGASFGF